MVGHCKEKQACQWVKGLLYVCVMEKDENFDFIPKYNVQISQDILKTRFLIISILFYFRINFFPQRNKEEDFSKEGVWKLKSMEYKEKGALTFYFWAMGTGSLI